MFRNILYNAFSLVGSREVRAFEKDSRNCRQAQEKKLRQILKANANTEYGQKFSFASIKNIRDFQTAVPVSDYDALSPYIDRVALGEANILTEQMPFMFATTSGTTGSRKLIPITESYLKEFRSASVTSGYNMLKHFPALAKGVALSVFSPAEEGRTGANVPYGAISGRLYLQEPALIRKFVSPIPYEVFLIKDYETRYYVLLRCALMLPVTCIYTLNPSTIALLGRRLQSHSKRLIQDIGGGTLTLESALPKNIQHALAPFLKSDAKRASFLQKLLENGEFRADKIWTDLSVVACWTRAAAAFYLQDLPELFGQTPICDITYGASEGRGTVFISPTCQALAIRSHFFEFIEVDKMDNANRQVLAADELELGKQYYILFTTSGGLYRYNINDIVQVVGWHNQTPCLEFLHKGGNICSFTGEKLTESQVTQAASEAVRAENIPLRFFTVVPEFRPEPHYELWLEATGAVAEADLQRLAKKFDDNLQEFNSEYEAKRSSSRLAPAQAIQLAENSYEELRKSLVAGGVPDAQIKISHLNPQESIKDTLRKKIKQPALSR